MEYISISEFAQSFGIFERTVRNWCASGKKKMVKSRGGIYHRTQIDLT